MGNDSFDHFLTLPWELIFFRGNAGVQFSVFRFQTLYVMMTYIVNTLPTIKLSVMVEKLLLNSTLFFSVSNQNRNKCQCFFD